MNLNDNKKNGSKLNHLKVDLINMVKFSAGFWCLGRVSNQV